MAYYDNITSPSTFSKAASAEDAQTFDALYRSTGWVSAVSLWGRQQLFASRVICSQPENRLALFVEGGFYQGNSDDLHPVIQRLISGPGQASTLANLWEPQLVQRFQPDSLGYTWAALAVFSRAAANSPEDKPERPQRERKAVSQEGFVSSTGVRAGSSSPNRPSSAETSASSIGAIYLIAAPLLEDFTVRLASCFVRCVLNYAQTFDNTGPYICYQDGRQRYSVRLPYGKRIEAVDDGGVQLCHGEDIFQVAMLEGKRTFESLDHGKPTVSDQTLAQMIGQALALKRSLKVSRISDDSFVTILAVTHYIKFCHFSISGDFIEEYESAPTQYNASMTSHLQVHSTIWFDINSLRHRKEIVSHLLALMAWARAQYERRRNME